MNQEEFRQHMAIVTARFLYQIGPDLPSDRPDYVAGFQTGVSMLMDIMIEALCELATDCWRV